MIVSSLRTTMSIVVIPTTAICKPMPTIVASLIELGMSLMTMVDIPDTEKIHSKMPEIAQEVYACVIVKPSPATIPYARYTLKPIPGASPKGKFAKMPQIAHPTALDKAVAVTT